MKPIPSLAFVSLLCLSTAVRAEEITTRLELDTRVASIGGELWRQFLPINHEVPLAETKSAMVKKIPAYEGTARYGEIRVGDGPNARYDLMVVHEPTDQTDKRRLYVDKNRNGDLTDDGDGKWATLSNRGNGVFTGSQPLVLRASWGETQREESSGDYAVMFVYLPVGDGSKYQLSFRGTTVRTGQLQLPGGAARVVLMETDGTAVFKKAPLDALAKNANPLHLFIDANGDGQFNWDERFDARKSFGLAGVNYRAAVSNDGGELRLATTTETPQTLNPQRVRPTGRPPALLAPGSVAPDFSALAPDGKTVKLSDFRGKIVILDFWATWCGPCKASMPALDALYAKTKDQGVVVFGVCVWDTRKAFDGWMAKPQVPTTYPLVFDPAGKNTENDNADSIASKHFNVTAIPTFYVIDREGKVAVHHVGSGSSSKAGLEAALSKLGVTFR